MAYKRLNLKDGDIFKAEHLNHIENALENISSGSSSSGGVISWNDLEDKPFYGDVYHAYYDFTEIPSVQFPIAMYVCYKISDLTLSHEQLLKTDFTTSIDESVSPRRPVESEFLLNQEDVSMFQFTSDPTLGFVTAYKTGTITTAFGTCNIPETGIYVVWGSDNTPPAFTIEMCCSEVKTLDKKYIPTLSWDKFIGEPSTVDILPVTDISMSYLTDNSCWEGYATLGENLFETGKTYTVVFDGETYNCTCKEDPYGYGIIYIGNGILLGLEDSGESFIIACDISGMISGVAQYLIDYIDEAPADETATIVKTVYIYMYDDGIEQIPDKLLPFGEYETTIFEWDGDTTVKEIIEGSFVNNDGFTSAKVSNEILSKEQIIGSTIYITLISRNTNEIETVSYVLQESDLLETNYGYSVILGNIPSIDIVTSDYTGTLDDPNKVYTITAGTYSTYMTFTGDMSGNELFTNKMTGKLVRPLDAKYLPKDTIIGWIDKYMEEALGGDY